MNIMPDSFSVLKEDLLKIKEQGFVPCTRPNNKDGGIGNTLEDLLKVAENNRQEVDYLDYEVKSQRESTSSAITLFSMATEKRNNRRLFNAYKKLDIKDNVERLYWSVYMHKTSLLYGRYECRLEFDDPDSPKQLRLRVRDTQTNQEDTEAYWDLMKMEKKIIGKVKNLVVCYAQEERIDNRRFFQYKNFECYFNFSFSKFLEFLSDGIIQVDFRIGADITGKNVGKYHDHGTGFRISGSNMLKLYQHVEKF